MQLTVRCFLWGFSFKKNKLHFEWKKCKCFFALCFFSFGLSTLCSSVIPGQSEEWSFTQGVLRAGGSCYMAPRWGGGEQGLQEGPACAKPCRRAGERAWPCNAQSNTCISAEYAFLGAECPACPREAPSWGVQISWGNKYQYLKNWGALIISEKGKPRSWKAQVTAFITKKPAVRAARAFAWWRGLAFLPPAGHAAAKPKHLGIRLEGSWSWSWHCQPAPGWHGLSPPCAGCCSGRLGKTRVPKARPG